MHKNKTLIALLGIAAAALVGCSGSGSASLNGDANSTVDVAVVDVATTTTAAVPSTTIVPEPTLPAAPDKPAPKLALPEPPPTSAVPTGELPSGDGDQPTNPPSSALPTSNLVTVPGGYTGIVPMVGNSGKMRSWQYNYGPGTDKTATFNAALAAARAAGFTMRSAGLDAGGTRADGIDCVIRTLDQGDGFALLVIFTVK